MILRSGKNTRTYRDIYQKNKKVHMKMQTTEKHAKKQQPMQEPKNIKCVVCQDILKRADKTIKLQCTHVYHKHCLMQWLIQSQTCPTCRRYTTFDVIYFPKSQN